MSKSALEIAREALQSVVEDKSWAIDAAHEAIAALSQPVADERAEFESRFKHLDTIKKDKDAWGQEKYAIQSLWNGWEARATLSQPAIKESTAQAVEPVAEVVSKHGDPEAFGEREIALLVDIQKLPYGAKFYAAPVPQEAACSYVTPDGYSVSRNHNGEGLLLKDGTPVAVIKDLLKSQKGGGN